MSKTFGPILGEILSISDIELERVRFAQLTNEQPDLPEYSKGEDIALRVLDALSGGEPLKYQPLIRAEKIEDRLVPADTPLNRGLFKGLGVVTENPNEIINGFSIETLSISLIFEDVKRIADLKDEEIAGLKQRVSDLPFLRILLA